MEFVRLGLVREFFDSFNGGDATVNFVEDGT